MSSVMVQSSAKYSLLSLSIPELGSKGGGHTSSENGHLDSEERAVELSEAAVDGRL